MCEHRPGDPEDCVLVRRDSVLVCTQSREWTPPIPRQRAVEACVECGASEGPYNGLCLDCRESR